MPALDSKVGDLAFCYGREEVEKESGKGIYTIKMVCCQNQNQYGMVTVGLSLQTTSTVNRCCRLAKRRVRSVEFVETT